MGNWPSNYTPTSIISGFGGKVVSNNWNEGGFGVTDMVMISGHRTVATKADLYTIPSQILSSNQSNKKPNNDGSDALGQLWYVQDEAKTYQLVSWANRGNANGWKRSNIASVTTNADGTPVYTVLNNNRNYDYLVKVGIAGDGSTTYEGHNFNLSTAQTNGVKLVYKRPNSSNTECELPVVNNTNTNGVITYSQYKSLLDRLTTLESKVIWKSQLANNKSTYLWSGSLSEFNALTSKPANTTFIVTN